MFRFFVIRCMNLEAEIVGRLLGRVVMWMMIAAPGALIFGPIGMYVWPFVYMICCRNSYNKLREKTDGFVSNMIDSVFRKIFTSYWCLSRAIGDQWNEININILIDSCIDLNMRDMFGKSLIIYACEKGMTEVANKLIDKGADIDVVDKYGETALMCACVRSRTEIADKLIDEGADVNVVGAYGETALIWACANDMTEVASKLIDKGADVNKVDKYGRTALVYACVRGMTEVARKLINKGIDVKEISTKLSTSDQNTFIKGANKYLVEEIKALNLPLNNIEKEMPDRLKVISDLRKFLGEINKNIKPDKDVFDELKDRWKEHEYDLNQLTIRCINVCKNLNTDVASSSINRPVIENINRVDYSRGCVL